MWRCRGLLNVLAIGRGRWVHQIEVKSSRTSATKRRLGFLAAGLASCAAVAYALESSVVEAAHMAVHPPKQPWGFRGAMASLDHAAIRRGWEVYKSVCSGCHSIRFVCFKDLVGVCLSNEEARAVAAEYQVRDGPDETGEYFMREAKLQDAVPSPYPNDEAARAANEGALPVDLSYVVNARPHGADYIFGLLTGYTDAPAGVELRDGQAFNPYFEGGAISMGEILQDGLVDYDDGTEATKSQMAKDVVEFLVWTSNQDWEERKLACFKGILLCALMFATLYPLYRLKMSHIKNTKICYIPRIKKGR